MNTYYVVTRAFGPYAKGETLDSVPPSHAADVRRVAFDPTRHPGVVVQVRTVPKPVAATPRKPKTTKAPAPAKA